LESGRDADELRAVGNQYGQRGRIEPQVEENIPYDGWGGLIIGNQCKKDNIASWNDKLSSNRVVHQRKPTEYSRIHITTSEIKAAIHYVKASRKSYRKCMHAQFSGSQKTVYRMFLGSPHPRRRIVPSVSGARSLVSETAGVLPMG
jgi:hypothetical protein